LEEDGEDSEIVMPLPDSSTEICTYDDTLSYFCLRLFENGIGLLKRFSLEANNRGSGTFHACEAIALNVTGCVTELFSAPSGVLAIAAGLPTENGPILVSSLTDGGSYLQYLSERVPVQNSRTNLPSIGSIEAVQILVNRSINLTNDDSNEIAEEQAVVIFGSDSATSTILTNDDSNEIAEEQAVVIAIRRIYRPHPR